MNHGSLTDDLGGRGRSHLIPRTVEAQGQGLRVRDGPGRARTGAGGGEIRDCLGIALGLAWVWPGLAWMALDGLGTAWYGDTSPPHVITCRTEVPLYLSFRRPNPARPESDTLRLLVRQRAWLCVPLTQIKFIPCWSPNPPMDPLPRQPVAWLARASLTVFFPFSLGP